MTEVMPSSFTIRVYALIINEDKQILICDEERFGMKMTKFPGGGLQFGEGPEDCMKREILEETGRECKIISHFYTTGFFQQSWFDESKQLIAIYYRATFIDEDNGNPPVLFENKKKDENIEFRYRPLDQLTADELTFPVDRFVLELLKKGFRQ